MLTVCRSRPAGTPPSLLLVTIDTLRADRVGCYGDRLGSTPVLDALCAEGWKFDPVFASAPLTLPSHATIFTGLEPPAHGVRANGSFALGPEHPTIATVLHDAGLATAAFVGAYPLDHRFGLARGFDEYDDRLGESPGGFHYRERPAAAVVDAASAWLEPRLGRRFFVWVHLYDPHDPYASPEPFRSRFAADPYRGEIAYADAMLGRLFELLKRHGQWDQTVVVVASDHGESLGEHGEETHGFFAYDATLRVPLIVKPARGQARPSRIGGARLLDVLPTVLGLLDVSAPGGISGEALLSHPSAPIAYAESLTPALDYNWAPLYSVRARGMKYIEAPRPELYDTARDPGELHDLATDRAHHDDVARLGGELQRLRRSFDPQATVRARARPDRESAAAIESLGYASGSTSIAEPVPAAARDPKDGIGLLKRIDEASSLEPDALEETIERLEAVSREDPTNNLVHRRLATALERAGRWARAAEEYDRAIALGYATADIAEGAARVYVKAGIDADRRGDDAYASRAFARAIELAPNDAAPLEARGVWLARGGKLDEASADFERSAALAADRWQPHYQLGLVALARRNASAAVNELAAASARGGASEPDVLFALGEAYRRANRPSDAAAALTRFLTVAPANDARRDVARATIARLKG